MRTSSTSLAMNPKQIKFVQCLALLYPDSDCQQMLLRFVGISPTSVDMSCSVQIIALKVLNGCIHGNKLSEGFDQMAGNFPFLRNDFNPANLKSNEFTLSDGRDTLLYMPEPKDQCVNYNKNGNSAKGEITNVDEFISQLEERYTSQEIEARKSDKSLTDFYTKKSLEDELISLQRQRARPKPN